MVILKNLIKDRLYFVLFFISLTLISYLSIYFSLVYNKPEYFPVVNPYFYIPFFFISMSLFFLLLNMFSGYIFQNKRAIFIFMFSVLFYVLIFIILSMINISWIQFHQFLTYITFSFIVSYSIYIGVRGIFSDEE